MEGVTICGCRSDRIVQIRTSHQQQEFLLCHNADQYLAVLDNSASVKEEFPSAPKVYQYAYAPPEWSSRSWKRGGHSKSCAVPNGGSVFLVPKISSYYHASLRPAAMVCVELNCCCRGGLVVWIRPP
jgi:hypothetical protein